MDVEITAFNGRCVIVESNPLNPLTDPLASLDVLRSTVEFGSRGSTTWMAYRKCALEAAEACRRRGEDTLQGFEAIYCVMI
ncbi:hypothetical protein JIR23_21600 [Bradyrhizobium diazoefficiens]|nr:hypothetical protein [Bradyrhizobium diazoefficiens]QQN62185.1 hypothetical protein JIR23_21600 [Bradyrhizobium diazoefficiens]